MNGPHSRVLIALDPGISRNSSLRAIASLVNEAVTEVIGLFVEDALLLQLARSPVAREITFEAGDRVAGTDQVERQFRAQAARLRAVFETETGRAGLRGDFRVIRGELATELMRAAALADVLVLSHSRIDAMRSVSQRLPLRELVEEGPSTLVFVQEVWSTGRRVAVLVTGPESESALRLAAEIARREHLDLSVLSTGGSAAADWAREALARAGNRPRNVHLHSLKRIGVEDLLRASHAEDARVMILPAGPVENDPGMIRAFLNQAACSLIIVR